MDGGQYGIMFTNPGGQIPELLKAGDAKSTVNTGGDSAPKVDFYRKREGLEIPSRIAWLMARVYDPSTKQQTRSSMQSGDRTGHRQLDLSIDEQLSTTGAVIHGVLAALLLVAFIRRSSWCVPASA
jgi:hypothetical protein